MKAKKAKVMIFGLEEYNIPLYERYRDRLDLKIPNARLNEDTAVFTFGCDAVVPSNLDSIHAAVIDELAESGVKLIALRSAGYDYVDIGYAKEKGLAVANVPDYSPWSIAEFAVALMLTVVRNTHKAYNRTREHNFSISQLAGFEFHGKTVGVIGEGKIGQCTVSICKGMGMKVLVSTPHPHMIDEVEYVSLDELYSRADVIQLHCPLNATTYHLINDEAIGKMKPGVVLVNTARGGLIESQALIRGLISGGIRAAGLDVYEKESAIFTKDYTNDILGDDVLQILLGFPNVLLSSHQAYFTVESLNGLCDTTVQNILEFYKTGTCRNLL